MVIGSYLKKKDMPIDKKLLNCIIQLTNRGGKMGLNVRKTYRIGKNTRINFSKGGGIGFSTGFKGIILSGLRKRKK